MNQKNLHWTQKSNIQKNFSKTLIKYQAKHPDIKAQLLMCKNDYNWIQYTCTKVYTYINRIPKERRNNNEALMYAFTLFVRIHGLSKNIKQALKSKDNPSTWDHLTLFIFGRALIEAVEMLFHTYLEDVTKDEQQLRIIYQRLRNNNDYIEKFNLGLNSEDSSEDDKVLLKAGLKSAEEARSVWINEATSNTFYKKLAEANKEPCLNYEAKKYCNDKYLGENRYSIEEKMDIITPAKYSLTYFYLSSYVHPYNISSDKNSAINTDPEQLEEMELGKKLAPLKTTILYLRYSTANIIHKLLLNEVSDLFSSDEIDKLRAELSKLRNTLISIPNAKELKLVTINNYKSCFNKTLLK